MGQEKDYWKIFEQTGSVLDYLSYRASCEDNADKPADHLQGTDKSRDGSVFS